MERVVSEARSRKTGTVVQVVDRGEYTTMPTGEVHPEDRWETICVDHGGVCSHETRELAFRFRPVPNEWCPTCQMAEAVQEIEMCRCSNEQMERAGGCRCGEGVA